MLTNEPDVHPKTTNRWIPPYKVSKIGSKHLFVNLICIINISLLQFQKR